VNSHALLSSIWKETWNNFISHSGNTNLKAFDEKSDLKYFEGCEDLAGLRKFVDSRNIQIEEGSPSDLKNTLWGLIKTKNDLINKRLENGQFEIFQKTINLLKSLKKANVKIAAFSTIKYSKEIVEIAKLEHLFDAILGCISIENLGLSPEPSPDILLQCCTLLGIRPPKCLVISNKDLGIASAHEGNFGLIVGLDSSGELRNSFRLSGANFIVRDIEDLTIWSLNDSFPFKNTSWTLSIDDPNPSKHLETLTTIGNGYFAVRGARDETVYEPDGMDSYPGTYVSGGYNRLTTDVEGTNITHESLVNIPNWAHITWREAGKEWFTWRSDEYTVEQFNQKLDIKEGMLITRYTVVDKEGHATTIISQRIVHMKKRHLGLTKYSIIAENWSGDIEVYHWIDGSVENKGVSRYNSLNGKHLKVHGTGTFDAHSCLDGIYLSTETIQSKVRFCIAKRCCFYVGDEREDPHLIETIKEIEQIGQKFSFKMRSGKILVAEIFTAVCNLRDRGSLDPFESATTELIRCGVKRFNHLLATHNTLWKSVWDRSLVCIKLNDDIQEDEPLNGNLGFPKADRSFNFSQMMEQFKSKGAQAINSDQLQFVLRFHAFHIVQTCSHNSIGRDVSIPARGIHGEAYRGHIFWDELFVLPTYIFRVPEVARSLLLYRYYRLDAARDIARGKGYFGACFPWQSGSTGTEETPPIHMNPLNKEWEADLSSLQYHVNVAIFYNFWHYYAITGDRDFMELYGDEVLLEIARFWGNKAKLNKHTGRYEIEHVMGPDEFHERYPGASEGGFNNNAYTNVMVAWCLDKALHMLEILPPTRRKELKESLYLSEKELNIWRDITHRMKVPFHDGSIISQFDGYENLKELDWEGYRRKYGNIQRLDRILRYEGDSPDNYKLSKQPDACMLFYVLTHEELIETLRKLGYAFSKDLILKNIEYYFERTSHGSTLSLVIFSHILYPFKHEKAWNLYKEFVLSDICDIQGGTTGEGIHIVPVASSINVLFTRVFGVDTSRGFVRFDPHPPKELEILKLRFQFQHRWLDIELTQDNLMITSESNGEVFQLYFRETLYELIPGSPTSFRLK